jgi:hypothetical protein
MHHFGPTATRPSASRSPEFDYHLVRQMPTFQIISSRFPSAPAHPTIFGGDQNGLGSRKRRARPVTAIASFGGEGIGLPA